ncbi:Transport and Golgi organization protein 6 homolog [Strongyloides ratti]|uniref:Transport and Golgi organization protein 6 homolog n=1 Tax=Strongyloides ratti TaxID=34506 RepID=A0A090LIZ7_STRRB|nr:Transport and Golgi organization protein 6 homolog [Strongyloides ratti]CEF68113.1 Transport and Golgi organization protein 6 homolog [Strongyloides ratti]
MQDSLKLLDFVTTFQDVKISKNSIIKFDPIHDAFCEGIKKFKEIGCFEKFEKYSIEFRENILISNDPRIDFSILLFYLYNNFLQEIKNNNDVTNELCLSIEQEKILSKSLEFFFSVSVFPCLESGVGIPITKLLKVPVKEWKKYGNLTECKFILKRSIEFLFKLLESNKKIKSIVVDKFLALFISANEQLVYYNINDFEENYNELIENTISSIFVFEALFAQYTNKGSPKWYKISCGLKLSKFLCRKTGLINFLTAIENLTEAKFFENSVCMNEMANLLGACPSTFSIDEYYTNILEQIFDLLLFSQEWTVKFRLMFGLLVDIIYKKKSEIINKYFVGSILNPWKRLLEKGIQLDQGTDTGLWSLNIEKSIILLETYLITGKSILRKKLCSNLLKSGYFYFWLNLTSQLEDDSLLKNTFKNILFGIISDLADNEKCKLFFNLLMKKGQVSCLIDKSNYFILSSFKKSNLLESEKNDKFRYSGISLKILDSLPIEDDKGSSIQKIFDNVKLLFNNLDIQLKLLTKFLKVINITKFEKTLLVQEVEDSKEKETRNRFVNIDEVLENNEEKMFSLMYILSNLMEYFINSTDKMKDSNTLINTTTIVEIIEVLCIIISRYNRKLVDSGYEEDENLKFSIAVLAAIILVAEDNDVIKKSLNELRRVLRNFIILSEKFEELLSLRDEAIGIIEIISTFLGVDEVDIKANKYQSPEQSTFKEKKRDLYEECLEDLKDELEAVKGHGLIVIAREIRKKNLQFLKKDRLQLLFDIVPDYVKDHESYVFLSGISVLAEIAYLQPDPYLFNLIDMFANYKDKDNVEFRGKLGEAIAKVCKQLGSLAPLYFDRILGIFLKNFKDEDEIIKASSLNALADLICACKGKKYGSVIYELLMGIDFLIKSNDSTPLVRRSTLHLLRSIIQSTDTQILLGTVIPIDILTKIYRQLKIIYQSDEDDIVKLHAQLILIDINESIKDSINEIESTDLPKIML